MQLMDLPFDLLELIFIYLCQIDWSGIDFVLVNRTTLALLHANTARLVHYLYGRPWLISHGVMYANAADVLASDYRALHHGVKYLEMGLIRKLEVNCTSVAHARLAGVEYEMQLQVSEHNLEQILGDWPAHKVVLVM